MFLGKIFGKKNGVAFLLCTILMWTGCSVDNADNEITMPDGNSSGNQLQPPGKNQGGQQPYTLAETEYQFNYYALMFYYLAASTQLKDINWYVGKGELAGFSSDYYEYPDIYYMYDLMDDNYTNYIGPYYAKQFDFSSATEDTYGIAVSVEANDSAKLVVTQVYPKGPGEKAGLKEGDIIISVGTTTPGDPEGFNKLTTGQAKDTISLKVQRGNDTLNIAVPLFCYKSPTVYLSYRDSIPVIKITEYVDASAISCEEANDYSFENGTADEFDAALKSTSGPTIIDLRGNGGGSVDQCLATTEALLSKGDTIILNEYTDIAPDSIHQIIMHEWVVATKDGAGKGRYYVFLADTNSASCAETMLIGATTNLKSPVVGMVTYGKNIGQYYIPTPANGYSIITSMKVYDKNHQSPHDRGILPDYVIADSLQALDKAVEIAKKATEKRSAGYSTERKHHFTDTFAKKASSSKGLPRGGAYKWKKLPFKTK